VLLAIHFHVLRSNSTVASIENFVLAVAQISRLGFRSLSDLFKRSLPFRSYLRLTIDQIFLLGIRSLPVVLVAGAATGSIMALQLGYGLQRFGGNLYIPAIVAASILRELGPILTSLLLAGRIGSGITAEIASMTVTQQIDAIRALGSNPDAELVVPRVIACLIVFPILALVGDYIGILSALLISRGEFGIQPRFFIFKTFESVHLLDIFGGLAKTVVFGLLISLLACWKGLSTRGGTRGVGFATTQVVVVSSILILVGDVFMSKLFLELGWFGAFIQ
jgi:phospholipid/cholesterol/gamma-HCH transport system permease protein